MKLLGLDVGNRRVGVAFGDSELAIATPLEVLERSSVPQDANKIVRLVRDYAAELIIVGLPRNTDGTLGEQARAVEGYVSAIRCEISTPLILWDEHLTTVEASRRTHESGGHGKKSRRNLDAIAAAVILQDYMDSQSNKRQNEE